MATSGDPETTSKRDQCLRCFLCSQTFRKPKTLGCAHTFCEGCLQSHARKLDEHWSLVDAIICPDDTCKRLTPITTTGGSPDELVESLPTNLAMVSLLEESQGQDDADGTLQDESAMCGPCLKRNITSKASYFCLKCNELQCSKCKDVHNSLTVSKGHSVINAERMQDKAKFKKASNDFERCDAHSKVLKFYCKDHSKLCCSTCAIITHRGCAEVAEIACIAKDSQSDARFRPLKGKLVALKQKLTDTSAFLDSTKEQVKCQFDVLPNEMETARQNILDKFAELQKQVTLTANDALNEHFEYINARHCVCKELNNKIHSTLRQYESYVTNGSPVQKFIAIEKLNQQYTCLQAEVSERLDKMNSLSFDIELTADLKTVLTAASVGKILIDKKEINVEPILYGKCELTLKKSVELLKGDKSVLPLLTGLAFLPDGRFVAVDNKNDQLILFDSDLAVLATRTCQGSSLDVTALNDYDINVTKGSRLFRYKVKISNEIEEKGEFRGSSKYDSVSNMKNDTYLVGLYDAERPACVVNEDGVETQLDINFKKKNYEIDDTRCCYSAATDHVILTEQSTNTVFIYGQSDGTELEVRDNTIKKPRGVAVSDQGCIFVCSSDNNSIVQISPSGSIIRSTRCEKMPGPCTVCIHQDGNLLAVSNNRSPRCLQIYNVG